MGLNFQAYTKLSVPRYTSYPTAPHFTPLTGAEHYAGWLATLDPAEPVSLYLHVPYCRELCWYCGCNMKLAPRNAPLTDYADTLIEEVRLVARHLPGRMKVSHLHWGGGTPTALEPDDLARVMDEVHKHYDFQPDAELAIESDPRTLRSDMTQRIGELGFTRASFGVQEFDFSVQTAINRLQPPRMVQAAVEALREVGVSGINFDLIYGLPLQTVEKIERTIGICVEMAPDRIALFGYAHVPWVAKRQKLIREDDLPGADERVTQAARASKRLREAGYEQIGMDHFARPEDALVRAAKEGMLRRNFQGYTTDTAQTLIGMGATSIGKTPRGYVQNFPETRAWSRAVAEGRLPTAKGCSISRDDAMRGAIIEAIMCQGEADPAEISFAHGVPTGWLANVEEQLQNMEADGLIARDGSRITLKEDARHLVRVIASVFDAYRDHSAIRYSVAV